MFPGTQSEDWKVNDEGFTAEVDIKDDGFPFKVEAIANETGTRIDGRAARYHAYVPYIEEEGVKLTNPIKIIVVGTHPPDKLGMLFKILHRRLGGASAADLMDEARHWQTVGKSSGKPGHA